MSGVFFASGNEFLAIFRENISVQKERLAESQERIDEVIRERREEFHVKRQRRGRWFDASAAAEEKFVYSGDVAYSLRQIERQAKRLTTLESFYREQKIIFSQGGNGDCKLSFDCRCE
jgi:GTP1/Obg family GTP-binding protein